MLPLANISRHLRLLLTALTLLCVMALNHREVTTFASPTEAQASQQLNKTAAERHGTVKQKVSLEAPHAFLVLQLAACTDFSGLDLVSVRQALRQTLRLPHPVTGFFKIFLSAVIQAKAP